MFSQEQRAELQAIQSRGDRAYTRLDVGFEQFLVLFRLLNITSSNWRQYWNKNAAESMMWEWATTLGVREQIEDVRWWKGVIVVQYRGWVVLALYYMTLKRPSFEQDPEWEIPNEQYMQARGLMMEAQTFRHYPWGLPIQSF